MTFFTKAVVKLASVFNRGQADDLGQGLMEGLRNWPKIETDAMIVFGSGEVSGAVAKRAAEAVAKGGVLKSGGTVYLTGGAKPWDKPFADELIPLQEQARIQAPEKNETEGAYMERIFRSELESLGFDASSITIKTENNSKNTQENIRGALAMGANEHETVSIVALPYHALHAMGTWRKEAPQDRNDETNDKRAVLCPILAWPEEAGISKDNWIKSRIARFVVADEGKKFLLPTPGESLYVSKGYCLPVQISVERMQAQVIASKQNKPATPKPPIG